MNNLDSSFFPRLEFTMRLFSDFNSYVFWYVVDENVGAEIEEDPRPLALF